MIKEGDIVEYEFYKDEEDSKIWDVTRIVNGEMYQEHGPYYFSFDKKTIYNFWTDYPDKLTTEQVLIFAKENPVMAGLKGIEYEELVEYEFELKVKNHEEPICPKCGKGRIVCPQGHIEKPHYFECTNKCGWHMNIDYADVIVE